MFFRDREDAGRQLARLLVKFEDDDPLVLGLPRGGVPVAAEVAHALDAELDVWVVRKIGAPEQPEYALGAVSEGDVISINREAARWAGAGEAEIEELAARKLREVHERIRKFRGDRPPPQIEGRTVIVIDDGLATGRTMRAALEALRARKPAKLVLAAPIADVRVLRTFRDLADELVVVEQTDRLQAIGLWYENFQQVSDEQVLELLQRARATPVRRRPPSGSSELEHTREVALELSDVELSGLLSVPPGARGVVIFVHGSGSSRFSPRNRFVASQLRKRGIGTLLFDLLTPLEEQQDARTAELRFDIPFLARRLEDVTEAVATAPETQNLGLAYFGASTGAAAALVAAARHPAFVKAIVSRGGRPDLAAESLPRVRAPTLLVVGGRDETVFELNQGALAELQCEKQLRIVPGATHLFEEPGALEQVAALAAEWFERCFAAAAHEVGAPGP